MEPAAIHSLRLFASVLAMLMALIASQAQQRDIDSIVPYAPRLKVKLHPLDSTFMDGGDLKRETSEKQIGEDNKLADPLADSTAAAAIRNLGRRIMATRKAEEEEEEEEVVEESSVSAVEKLGINVVKNPPDSKLAELGVRSWPRWAFAPSKFPWTYSANETSYLLEGKATVYPEGSEEGGVDIAAGDLIDFPKGMTCTWQVSVAIYKHYKFNQ